MALSSAMVWEVRSDGNDANGGAFKTGASGTDYSQQASPHVTIDGATITAVVHITTTQLNITGYTVAAGDVGNVVNINGGTATAGRYEITAVDTGNNRWTLDRSAGTASQTATGRMGGCLLTMGQAGASANVNGHTIYAKAYTETLTTTVAGAAGPVRFTNRVHVIGYSSTRGDDSANYVVSAGAQTSITIWQMNSGSSGSVFRNITVDGNNGSGNHGYSDQGYVGEWINCHANNCSAATRIGFINAGSRLVGCSANNCTTGFYNCSRMMRCRATNCGTGFVGSMTAVQCVADACTTDGFTPSGSSELWFCTADANARYGFNSGGNACRFYYCVASNHSGVGDAGWSNGSAEYFYKCFGYNNTSNLSGSGLYNIGFTTLSADPYVSQATGDYRPNATANGGASLRSANIAIYGQTNNFDAGAVQHSDPTSGGGTTVIVVEDD